MARSFHPSKKHSDIERWICIYPAYINVRKTKAEGRILSKDKCVDNPSYEDICEILSSQKMKFLLENKVYSRERSHELNFRGRVRVQLKKDDGTPLNPNYPTRESILLMLGELIPKLKSRVGKQGGGDPNQHRNAGNSKKDKGKGKRR